METLEEKIRRVLRDRVELVSYDPAWPLLFEEEKRHLLSHLPEGLIIRIEHYGSTSIPGMIAKPVVDMLVEVPDLERVRELVPPILEAQGYDYFWRPTSGDDTPPFYAWFIKRDETGLRTHHIHMVEPHFRHWEGLVFRDYLITHPNHAEKYAELKTELARRFGDDRIAYTEAKTEFIHKILMLAQDQPSRIDTEGRRDTL